MRSLLTSLLLLAALPLLACRHDRVVSPEAAPVAAAPRAASGVQPLVGVVASRTSEVVAAQVDGRIVRVIARSGQQVRKGDPIAELDPTELAERQRAAQAAVDAARADVVAASADMVEARRQMALEKQMYAANATALEAVRVAKANVARAGAAASRASAALRVAEATRAAVEAQLSHTRLEAPIDGVVSLVKAQPGEVVQPGAALARVFDPSSLMIRFQVPHDRRRDVAVGTVVELSVAGAPHPVRATVTSVSSDLEPPLDFAVAEADIVDTLAARDITIGQLGDVTVVASR